MAVQLRHGAEASAWVNRQPAIGKGEYSGDRIAFAGEVDLSDDAKVRLLDALQTTTPLLPYEKISPEYMLGDCDENYTARMYRFDDQEVSSEYLPMSAEAYYDIALECGARRTPNKDSYWYKRTAEKQPAMMELLNYIWERE